MSQPLPPEPVPHIDGLKIEKQDSVFDASVLQNQSDIPSQFIWPEHEQPCLNCPELPIISIDLGSFPSGDLLKASEQVNEACKKLGFFQVVNHGVDLQLIAKAHEFMDMFFGMPLSEKQRAQMNSGDGYGYANSLFRRFCSRLSWKETLSLHFCAESQSKVVQEYFFNLIGDDLKQFGSVFQEYCEAMSSLSVKILELLGISLGVDRAYFPEFFQGSDFSMLRLNYYPPCQKPDLTLGTGAHCDPIALAILHQDDVGGLQVFMDEKWHSVRPHPEAFLSTLALSNGIYKSCPHRAVVNNRRARKSLVFFLSPKLNKVIKPPNALLHSGISRMYPDFTYSAMIEFLQKHSKVPDMKTFHVFTTWLKHQSN